MMARKVEPLKIRIFINGEERSVFTPEEQERMRKRMSDTMSEYFRLHPDEYADLCRRQDEKAARERRP